MTWVSLFKVKHEIHIPVSNHNYSQVFYLANEDESPGKGANTVVSYVHHYLHHYGLGKEKAVFPFDNCA
ncbi:hypothetical protein DPMN_190158 [Dreissena polymorpha]|uniref:Uncharacterized protein n=1 Tax=Dreissena polymorpha TaxID=45954 RepID=A0A9D4DTA6_DREPO|nr:hypothetical protein DPMN_190158 [Dreissena polymorpha]